MYTDYAKKFNDAVAGKTSWQPLKKGGFNFKTFNLEYLPSGRLAFKPTRQAIVFYIIFITAGLGFLIDVIYTLYSSDFDFVRFELINFAIGMIFLLSGISMAIRIKAIVFDRSAGYYWRGRRKVQYSDMHRNQKVFSRIMDIYALQLLSEYIQKDKGSYHSYELNIVFRDGSRKHLLDHSKIEDLKREAEELSSYISRPLWADTVRRRH